MAQVSVFSPWKDASRSVGGADASVMMYVKHVGDLGAAGTQIDQATVQVAAGVDTITFRYAEGGGAIAVDTDIDSYTGATGAGAAGTITTTDANANSILEQIRIVNGMGVGQTATRRWRAAPGDLPPSLATVASDYLVRAQTNVLLGENHIGLPLFNDSSNVGAIAANDIWVGIGTDRGTLMGAQGWRIPDYFEDIPGASTVAGVNTPVRSAAVVPRKAQESTTRLYQYRITGFSVVASFATTALFCVHDWNNNVLWQEPLTAAAATAFQDRSDTPIVGPVGEPLFCRFNGTGALTDGAFSIRAEVRAV
jgi:hypothetical protein